LSHKYQALDGFRGVAALLVVLFHTAYVGSVSEAVFIQNSYLFVHLFFILSGFVMSHAYGERDVTFKFFFIKRFFRIFPLHVLMLIVFIVMEFAKLILDSQGFHFNNTPFSNGKEVVEILPNLLLIQSWVASFNTLSWNFPSWSVSIEFYMYMIFFIISYIKLRYIWVIIFLLCTYFLFKSTSYSYILNGLMSFPLGIFIYSLHKNLNVRMNFSIMSVIEGLSIFSIFYLLADKNPNTVLVNFLFSMLVLIFALEQGMISKIMRSYFFTYLGKISYSIYMTHVAIIAAYFIIIILVERFFNVDFFKIISGTRYIDFGNPVLNNVALFSFLILVVFISSVTYKVVEKRGIEYGNNKLL
jgi:peptidoglycan/LPS O-acetylase OafA/YrhL